MHRLQKEELWQKHKSNRVVTAEKVSLEQAKSQFEIERMRAEAEIKRGLMAEEFNFNMQLAQIRANAEMSKNKILKIEKIKE
jgi:hypothetical protein